MDPRGRTPLELAVSLGHLESARVLLRHNANVGRENANGWTVLQEAVSTGDPEMVQLVLQYRDYQRATRRLAGIPELLSKLRRASDFYVEMKWEFTSWVPLVSKVCPSDVYRVWKRGESLRVDTTLLGFEHMTWQRGRRSYIFKGEEEGAVVMEVDHDKQVVYTETLALALHEPDLLLAAMQPSEEHVAGRLTSPIVSTHLDTRNIAFERNKSGIWGWRSEKMEVVSGYEAKVYSASNVELVTKTRTEHLSDQDKSRSKGTRAAGGQPHQPHGHHPRGVLRPTLRPGGPQHRAPYRGVQQGAEVQGDAVAMRAAPAVTGGAGDAHHRPDGHLQRPLRQAARLHHPQAAPWLPRQDRDPPLPRPQRPHHLQQPLWLRPAAGLRAGLRPRPAPRRAAHRPWRLALPVRGGAGGVRGAAGLHGAGRGAQRAPAGRGRRPAAVRHPAEPARRRHRDRPGDGVGGADQHAARRPPPALRRGAAAGAVRLRPRAGGRGLGGSPAHRAPEGAGLGGKGRGSKVSGWGWGWGGGYGGVWGTFLRFWVPPTQLRPVVGGGAWHRV
uniref:Ankyrin repeat domain 13D n=1 Tax=Anser brachyrhynchus TaxID=132585 RepID=A0A8B9D188_9AVES